MIIETKNFGLIEVIEEKILKFPNGIYGFEDSHDFVLLSQDQDELFVWMQSIKYKDLCFVMANPFKIIEGYEPPISEGVKKALSIQKDDGIELLCIVTIPGDDPSKMTINLKCPIIINNRNHIAVQEIIESDKYTFRYRFLEDLQKMQKGKESC